MAISGSAVVVIAIVLAAACGCGGPPGASSPSTDSSAPAPNQQVAPFCETWVETDVAGRSLLQVNYASATPEQLKAVVRSFWAEEEPILESLEREVPPELTGDVEPLIQLARDGKVSGAPGTLSSPEIDRSDRAIDDFMLRQCPYPHLAVTATDAEYVGAPATVKASTIALVLTNRGQDAHEIFVCQIDPGETRPFRDILASAKSGCRAPITPIAVVEADPGDTRAVFVPLVAGRYGWYDGLLQGTTSISSLNGGKGPPHFSLGLVHEIVVQP
jgi:hypothetical protein